MEKNRHSIKFRDSNTLLKIKQRAIVLRELLEKSLDPSKPWPEKLEIYSRCANCLQDLQSDLSDIPESNNYVLVPDYELHEIPDYAPNLICPILNENIEKVASDCSKEFVSTFHTDYEQKAMNFNSFCHDLRKLFKK